MRFNLHNLPLFSDLNIQHLLCNNVKYRTKLYDMHVQKAFGLKVAKMRLQNTFKCTIKGKIIPT